MTHNQQHSSVDGAAILRELIKDHAQNPRVHETKVCLFLGAGADISSGGLTFTQLKRATVDEFTGKVVFDITSSEYLEGIFERVYEDLPEDDRGRLIDALIQRMGSLPPSDGYRLLVLLAEAGAIDAIVTTNFDTMLEKAQLELGRNVFQVFSPGLARPYPTSLPLRYELPLTPYIKLHGDLASRCVTHIRKCELDEPNYDTSMLSLLKNILQTHHVIFVGYSGLDQGLADILANEVLKTNHKVFVCSPNLSPSKSPLYERIWHRVVAIRMTFDELLVKIGKPVLRRPALLPTRPTYLRCLFDWRVDYCNEEYLRAYGWKSGRSIINLLARRPNIERRLSNFLLADRPLALIAGPSGFGKTSIGLRLFELWRSDSANRIMLIRSKSLNERSDIEQFVAEQLGGLGAPSLFTLHTLERWLRENGLRLVLFIDAINEFSPEAASCVQFFRSILRLCYFLPEKDSALRVIATMRQESWHSMLPQLDDMQLRKTLWTDTGSSHSINAISCGELSDEELGDALGRLREDGVVIKLDRPNLATRLRDPYILAATADTVRAGLPAIPGALVFGQVIEARLRRANSEVSSETLKAILASVAIRCIKNQQDRFRELDVEYPSIRHGITRCAKDMGLIVDTDDGFLQFSHDRIFEYFLSLGIASRTGPSLETSDDLCRYLTNFQGNDRALSSARQYFQLAPRERFSIIEYALKLMDDETNGIYRKVERELMFGFARDVLAEMVEQLDEVACQYLTDALDAARAKKVGTHQLRTLVRIAATLPTERAIPLLTRVSHPMASQAGTEATIFTIDKLVTEYQIKGCQHVDFGVDEPYATFFADSSISSWNRLGRILSFVAQLGPDNMHPDEYARFSESLRTSLTNSLNLDLPKMCEQAGDIAEHFLQNCDRLLFNAKREDIDCFFGKAGRHDLLQILDRLENGIPLSLDDFKIVRPYTETLGAEVEYNLSHIFFILSSLNSYEATLKFAEDMVATFSDETPPPQVDFFQAVLVYLNIINSREYDEDKFKCWEEVILKERRTLLMYRPGNERGERRGFKDAFDRYFEDGFGVIYPYGILRPSARRICQDYSEYREELSTLTISPLPMYTDYLEQYLKDEMVDEAIQVLQALAGVIVAWPTEGLLALRATIGHPHPLVRRATVRVLAEAYCRHPEETNHFILRSGAAVSDEDMLEIKIRQDARIGRRQVKEEEWARIAHFLFSLPRARETCINCLRALIKATSFKHAVAVILDVLAQTTVAR